MPNQKEPNPIPRVLRLLSMVGQLGLGLIAPAVVFTLLGVVICRCTGCGIWLVALLFFAGLLGGMVATLRTVFAYLQMTKKEESTHEQN